MRGDRFWVSLVVGVVFAAGGVHAQRFEAVLLGTGIPLVNPARAGAATLIIAGETTVLVDAGRGAVTGLVGAGYQDVSLAVFTHFHSDHIAGFGEIMVNRSIAGSDVPLSVLGPKGTAEVVAALIAPFAWDTQYRIAHHHEHWPVNGMKASVVEKEPGVIYDEDGLKITMFDVDHEPILPAVGYRFDFAGKSIVVSGDTKKTQSVIDMARGCDVLIHEAIDAGVLTPMQAALARTNPRQGAMLKDMMSHHTTTIELAEIARDAGVKKLVLTHLVPSIPATEVAERNFVRGMSEVYGGAIVVGRDGMRVVP